MGIGRPDLKLTEDQEEWWYDPEDFTLFRYPLFQYPTNGSTKKDGFFKGRHLIKTNSESPEEEKIKNWIYYIWDGDSKNCDWETLLPKDSYTSQKLYLFFYTKEVLEYQNWSTIRQTGPKDFPETTFRERMRSSSGELGHKVSLSTTTRRKGRIGAIGICNDKLFEGGITFVRPTTQYTLSFLWIYHQ